VINLPEETQPSSSPAPAKSSDQNLMAAICYISFVSVIILLTRKDNEFIQFHAKQGTVIFVAWVILVLLYVPLLFIPVLGWILNTLGWLVVVIASIVGFIKAYSGEKYRLPLIADLADKIKI
jgi:uncharacterized membrane protein